ncbi:MAG: DUF2812 domain-containing protein [Firmicutes bacterium]|nr:DUF2812 domain-containing protein [Bacillota bacterium]
MAKEKNTLHRLPPCPAYDVEATESWLTDLAEEGWLLQKDGFFGGFASFERASAPCSVRYRLEAADKNTGMFSDNGGDPDPEAVELSQSYGWEYVAKRGEFYIYRSFRPGTRELTTDPEVQALGLQKALKRQKEHLSIMAFWCLVYPLAKVRFGIMGSLLTMTTLQALILTLMAVWLLGSPILTIRHLRGLQKKLQKGEPLNHGKDWTKKALLHHGKRALLAIFLVVWVCFAFTTFSDSVMDADEIPLAEWTKDPPCATLGDIAVLMAEERFGDGATGGSGSGGQAADSAAVIYRLEDLSFLNTLRYQKNWLSRESYLWEEAASAKLARGSELIAGCLSAEYHEARAPWIASWAIRDYNRFARWQWTPFLKHIGTYKALPEKQEALQQKLDAAGITLDYLAVFIDEYGFTTVQMQKGCKLISAHFTPYNRNNADLTDWAFALANSIQ